MKPRDVIAVAAVSTIVVIAGAWFAFIGPKRSDASRLGDQIAQTKSQLQDARDQVRTYDAARDAYPANYAAVARLGKAIPPDANTASLIEQLSESSKKTHVRFRGVTVGSGLPTAIQGGSATTTAAVTGPTANPFQFKFQGRFFRLSRFLRFLERYVDVKNGGLVVDGRLLTIDGFTLGDGNNPSPTAGDVTATVRARAYSISDLLNGATPGAPAPVAASSGSGSTPAAVPAATIGAVTP